MRKLLTLGAILATVFAGCENKTPTGPGTVTVQQVTTTTTAPPTVPPTTTTVPGQTTTTVLATTTIPLTNVTRRYVGTSTQATVPNDMTLFFQLLFASTNGSRSDDSVFTTMATYSVSGVYRTSGGGGGTVKGELSGEIDNGQFGGTVIFDAPGCTAEREYTGVISGALLSLSGGRTLRDCKDAPLSWGSLTLVRGDGLPITTSIPTTTPGACTYNLSPTGATIGAGGGVGEITVTTQPGCGWSAQSFVPWVTVLPPSANGSGKAQYTVQASGTARTATLVVAGKSFILTQSAPGVTTTTSTSTSSTSSSSTTVPGGSTTTSSTSSSSSTPTSSSSSSTSTSTSTSTSSTTTSLGPSFASTVYTPHMVPAGCGGCHGFSSSGAAFTFARANGRSDTTSSNFVTMPAGAPKPNGSGPHLTLWPAGQAANLAAIAWINGGHQP